MGLPQLKNLNTPNLNVGLGSVANSNTPSAPANSNSAQYENNIANRLAAVRASSVANDNRNIRQTPDPDMSDDIGGGGAANENMPVQARSPRQKFADPSQQQRIAAILASQKQAQMQTLANQEQQLDKEIDQLIQQLGNFRDSKAKRYIALFQPALTSNINRVIGHLKTRSANLNFRRRIAFLKAALVTLQTLIAGLTAFKFVASFIDAVFLSRISAIQLIMKLAVTIVGAIIMIIISFIYVPFLSVIFLINRFPLMHGKLTKEVVELIKNLKQQKQSWQQQLAKLQEIVSRQDQRDMLQKQRAMLAKPSRQ
jgi:cell division protein FtsB